MKDPAKFSLDGKRVKVIQLFNWFGQDFGKTDAQRLTWLANHAKDPAVKKTLLDRNAKLEFLDWDWALNERS